MLLRPYLKLYRKRLVIAAIYSLFFALLVAVMSPHPRDLPPASAYAPAALQLVDHLSAVLCIFVGLTLGLSAPNELRFLLTRPVARRSLQFHSLFIAIMAIGLIPAPAWLVLLVCARVFHAVDFTHMAAMVELTPSAFGQEHGVLAHLAALHIGRRYLAEVSVGLDVYAPLAAVRWLVLHTTQAFRIIGRITMLMLFFSLLVIFPLLFLTPSVGSAVLLLPAPQAGGAYLPSNLGIALHLAFAAAWICGTSVALRHIEV